MAANQADAEDTIEALLRQLDTYQRGPQRCAETDVAIIKLREARQWLASPAARRQRQGGDSTGAVRPRAAGVAAPPPASADCKVLLVAPRKEPGTAATLAHRFSDVPDVTVVEDRRTGWDRRMVKGGRLFVSHRKGERREGGATPKNGRFIGAIRWVRAAKP